MSKTTQDQNKRMIEEHNKQMMLEIDKQMVRQLIREDERRRLWATAFSLWKKDNRKAFDFAFDYFTVRDARLFLLKQDFALPHGKKYEDFIRDMNRTMIQILECGMQAIGAVCARTDGIGEFAGDTVFRQEEYIDMTANAILGKLPPDYAEMIRAAISAHSGQSPKKQGREDAARLVNEIYHSDELRTYAKSKKKKKTSRQLAIEYIRNDEIPTASKFYDRAKAVRASVLTTLAKSSSEVDVQAAWNSILTIAKQIDPKKGTRHHTDAFLEEQAERRHDNDNKPGVVPNIGDKSSRYSGW